MELIDKDVLVEYIRQRYIEHQVGNQPRSCLDRMDEDKEILSYLNTLEVKDVDLEKESEFIANGIMISVQSNKYGTNIYNTQRNDFNHYHLQMAARKGIELGIKAQKGE